MFVSDDDVFPVLQLLSVFSGYDWDEGDMDAIAYGLQATDFEENQWFEYAFHGRETLRFRMAKDNDGSGLVIFEFPECGGLRTHIDVVWEITHYYQLRNRENPVWNRDYQNFCRTMRQSRPHTIP